mmetsp:Transcript_38836/g.123472  ORF Transcript_38836/g.123472 Transcript_38836/m.123472 type:complete len:418 (-) Transcript_38836:882-2135(-)
MAGLGHGLAPRAERAGELPLHHLGEHALHYEHGPLAAVDLVRPLAERLEDALVADPLHGLVDHRALVAEHAHLVHPRVEGDGQGAVHHVGDGLGGLGAQPHEPPLLPHVRHPPPEHVQHDAPLGALPRALEEVGVPLGREAHLALVSPGGEGGLEDLRAAQAEPAQHEVHLHHLLVLRAVGEGAEGLPDTHRLLPLGVAREHLPHAGEARGVVVPAIESGPHGGVEHALGHALQDDAVAAGLLRVEVPRVEGDGHVAVDEGSDGLLEHEAVPARLLALRQPLVEGRGEGALHERQRGAAHVPPPLLHVRDVVAPRVERRGEVFPRHAAHDAPRVHPQHLLPRGVLVPEREPPVQYAVEHVPDDPGGDGLTLAEHLRGLRPPLEGGVELAQLHLGEAPRHDGAVATRDPRALLPRAER